MCHSGSRNGEETQILEVVKMSYMLVKVVGETEEEIFLPVQKSDCFEGNILHWSGDFVRMAKWIL